MAEALGVAASGIAVVSLTMQVARSIKSLKDFCSLIASAPTEILLAIDEIEALSLILEEIDSSMQESFFCDPRTKVVVARCYGLCQSSAETLRCLVEEMEDGLMKGKMEGNIKGNIRGGLRFAMKQSALKSLRRRLESAKMTMILANQCFDKAIQKQNWESYRQDIVNARKDFQRLETLQMMVVEQKGDVFEDTARDLSDWEEEREHSQPAATLMIWRNRQRRRELARNKERYFGCLEIVTSRFEHTTEKSLSIAFPNWIYPCAWKLHVRNTYCGWDHSFRTYRVVTNDAPIFRYCRDGDVAGLQRLFGCGEATPFEITPKGWTPLHYAAFHVQPGVCRFLLENYADTDISSTTPLHLLSDAKGSELSTRETLEILLTAGGCDPFYSNQDNWCAMAQPQWPVSVFRWLRQNQDFELQQIQQDEHVELLCWRISSAQSDKDIRTCRELIPGGKVTAALAKYVLKYGDYGGYTLLGAALESWHYRLDSTADKDELENFIRELIAQGANLHHCRQLTGFSRPPTLLQTLVRWKINHGAHVFKQAVKELLVLFRTAGVDLLVYWEVEQSYGWQSFDPAAVSPPWNNAPIYKIINIQIGERPEDILIELEAPYFTTPLLANFWHWVEPPSDQDRNHNSTSIPGAWQDE